MNTFERGQMVEQDGLLAVVVGLAGDEGVPDEHLARSGMVSRKPSASQMVGKGARNLWSIPCRKHSVDMPGLPGSFTNSQSQLPHHVSARLTKYPRQFILQRINCLFAMLRSLDLQTIEILQRA